MSYKSYDKIENQYFELHIESTWRKDYHLSDKSLQTDRITYETNQTQTNQSFYTNSNRLKDESLKNTQVQTDSLTSVIRQLVKITPKPDEQSLNQFIQRAGKLMLNELSENSSDCFDGYDVNWNEEIDSVEVVYQMQLPEKILEKHETPLSATDIAWNCTGNWIAVSYGRIDKVELTFESGYVSVWSISKMMDKPEFVIEVEESYLMRILFHPSKPDVLVGGTFTGEIKVWRLRPDTDPLLMSSKIEKYSHENPVSGLTWIESKENRVMLLASMSCERILMWSFKNNLSKPIACFLLTSPRQKEVPLGASCFAFINIYAGSVMLKRKVIPQMDTPFLMGTESGKVYKSVLASKTLDLKNVDNVKPQLNPINAEYESSVGYIHAVSCSPFHRNIFLACSSDGLIRIYNALKKQVVLTLEPCTGAIFDACWSPFKPLVIAAVADNGHLYIYDLDESFVKPVVDIAVGNTPLVAVRFNSENREYIATCDAKGVVKIITCSNNLSEYKQAKNKLFS